MVERSLYRQFRRNRKGGSRWKLDGIGRKFHPLRDFGFDLDMGRSLLVSKICVMGRRVFIVSHLQHDCLLTASIVDVVVDC